MQLASEEQKLNTHLIIGPWDHTSGEDVNMEYDFGPDSKLDIPSIEKEFFERHLKGNAIKGLAPVRIFVMGRNEWRDESEWPIKRAIQTKYYLHSKGDVRGAWVKGNLSTEPPKDEKSDKFTYISKIVISIFYTNNDKIFHPFNRSFRLRENKTGSGFFNVDFKFRRSIQNHPRRSRLDKPRTSPWIPKQPGIRKIHKTG